MLTTSSNATGRQSAKTRSEMSTEMSTKKSIGRSKNATQILLQPPDESAHPGCQLDCDQSGIRMMIPESSSIRMLMPHINDYHLSDCPRSTTQPLTRAHVHLNLASNMIFSEDVMLDVH